jgi:hypothetical protein
LSKEWNDMPDARKQKWLGIARRYAALSPIEQARTQDRMREWIALTPAQRELARNQYKRIRAAAPEQKIELSRKWQEYEALSSDEKERLKATPAVQISISSTASQPAGSYAITAPKLLTQAPPSNKLRPLAATTLTHASSQPH